MPANIGSGRFDTTPDLVIAGGFPVMSIMGKVFHYVKGGERTLITREIEGDTIPAPSIEVVVINANKNTSKIYYAKAFEDGDEGAPDCYSVNGDKPELDSTDPQCKTCAACPHNVWGSRITESGTKAKNCSDARRVAAAKPDALDEPFLLRVPPTSLKPLGEYQELLHKHGAALQEVVTKVAFDPSMAYPTLTFKPVGFLSEAADLDKVEEMMTDTVVLQIIGHAPTAALAEAEATKDNLIEDDDEDEVPDPAVAKKAAAAAKRKATAAKKKAAAEELAGEAADEVAEAEALLADEFEVEETPAPPKKKAAVKKSVAKKAAVAVVEEEADTGESDGDLVDDAMQALDEFEEFDGFAGFDD
jgi:hypothetical protein